MFDASLMPSAIIRPQSRTAQRTLEIHFHAVGSINAPPTIRMTAETINSVVIAVRLFAFHCGYLSNFDSFNQQNKYSICHQVHS